MLSFLALLGLFWVAAPLAMGQDLQFAISATQTIEALCVGGANKQIINLGTKIAGEYIVYHQPTDQLFFGTYNGTSTITTIERYNRTSGVRRVVRSFLNGASYLRDLQIDPSNNRIFFITGDAKLWSVSLDGTSASELSLTATGACSLTNGALFGNLAAAGGQLYFAAYVTSGFSFCTVSQSGGTAIAVATGTSPDVADAQNVAPAVSLLYDRGNLIWHGRVQNPARTYLVSTTITTGTSKFLISHDSGGVPLELVAVSVVGESVYVLCSGCGSQNQLYVIPLSSTNQPMPASKTGQDLPLIFFPTALAPIPGECPADIADSSAPTVLADILYISFCAMAVAALFV